MENQEVKWIGIDTVITVICPEHGEFQVTAGNHLSGEGCHKCPNYFKPQEISEEVKRWFDGESETM